MSGSPPSEPSGCTHQGHRWVSGRARPEAQGALPPSRWHCLSWESLPQRGVSGQEGQEAEVRASQGEGPQVERKPGAQPGASNVFPPAQARAPGSPSEALNQLSLPSAAPILGPGEMLTLQRQRAFFPEGLIRVSSSLFSFKKRFLKRDWLSCAHNGARGRADRIINAMLTRTEYSFGDLLKAFYAFKPPGIPEHGYKYCPRVRGGETEAQSL